MSPWMGPSKVCAPFVNSYVLASFIDQSTIHHYLGWDGHEPVVPRTIVYEAGVAGIYIVATKPAYRGKGYGRTTPPHGEGRHELHGVVDIALANICVIRLDDSGRRHDTVSRHGD